MCLCIKRWILQRECKTLRDEWAEQQELVQNRSGDENSIKGAFAQINNATLALF